MKILITGASGFIGNNISLNMVKLHEVYYLSKNESEFLNINGLKYINIEILHEINFNDYDYIIHCSGNPNYTNGDSFKNDYSFTKDLINCVNVTANKSLKFIYISSLAVHDRIYGDDCNQLINETSSFSPCTDYGYYKRLSEIYLIDSGLSYIILRPACVIGPDMRTDSHFSIFISSVLRNKIYTKVAWPGIFSFIHIDDFVDIINFVIKKNIINEIFICSSYNIALSKLYKIIEPTKFFLNINFIAKFKVIKYLPYKIKALLLPANACSNARLLRYGWFPNINIEESLRSLIERERSRVFLNYNNFGLTLITGACSGLGLAILEEIVAKRNKIILIDIDLDKLKVLCGKYSNCEYLHIDLSKLNENFSEYMPSNYYISELYLCAGIGQKGLFVNSKISRQLDTYRVNLLSRVEIIKYFIMLMRRYKFGKIAVISSSTAFQATPLMSSYSSSNVALLFFGEALYQELIGSGIRLKIICPSGMKSNFQVAAGVKNNINESLLDPSTVARKIIDSFTNNKIHLLIGKNTFITIFISKFFPKRFALKIWMNLMIRLR